MTAPKPKRQIFITQHGLFHLEGKTTIKGMEVVVRADTLERLLTELENRVKQTEILPEKGVLVMEVDW